MLEASWTLDEQTRATWLKFTYSCQGDPYLDQVGELVRSHVIIWIKLDSV